MRFSSFRTSVPGIAGVAAFLAFSATPAVAQDSGTAAGSSGFIEQLAGGLVSPFNAIALLTAVAIAYLGWQAWNARPRIENAEEVPRTSAPSDLHPAIAGALATGQVNGAQVEATVIDLARRGALAIEPDDDAGDKVQIRIIDTSRADTAFEERLLELLEDRASDGLVSYKSLSRMKSQLGPVRDAIRKELEARGWFNPQALQLRLPFLVPGWIGIALAVGALVVAILAGDGWPVLGGVVVGIAGLVSLGASGIMPRTTRDGEHRAIPWRSYRTGLALARDKEIGAVNLDEAFPYIVAMGMSAQFDRHLRRASQTGYIPNWLRPTEIVQSWPESWYVYWIALHTALAPTDPANTKPASSDSTRRSLFGGRF